MGEDRSGRDGDGFHRKLGPPVVESSFEGHRIYAVSPKLLCHTGTGGLVQSGAIGDYRLILGQFTGPLCHTVGVRPEAVSEVRDLVNETVLGVP